MENSVLTPVKLQVCEACVNLHVFISSGYYNFFGAGSVGD